MAKSVLVIEDNELNLKLLKAFLEIGKYQTLTAFDAESGIAMAREHRPDLIVMDIQLPGIDGLNATRIIKDDPALKGIKIIGLSGYAQKEDQERAIEAGCEEYLTKPISLENFLEAVSRHLE